jgi:hypothetical protein
MSAGYAGYLVPENRPQLEQILARVMSSAQGNPFDRVVEIISNAAWIRPAELGAVVNECGALIAGKYLLIAPGKVAELLHVHPGKVFKWLDESWQWKKANQVEEVFAKTNVSEFILVLNQAARTNSFQVGVRRAGVRPSAVTLRIGAKTDNALVVHFGNAFKKVKGLYEDENRKVVDLTEQLRRELEENRKRALVIEQLKCELEENRKISDLFDHYKCEREENRKRIDIVERSNCEREEQKRAIEMLQDENEWLTDQVMALLSTEEVMGPLLALARERVLELEFSGRKETLSSRCLKRILSELHDKLRNETNKTHVDFPPSDLPLNNDDHVDFPPPEQPFDAHPVDFTEPDQPLNGRYEEVVPLEQQFQAGDEVSAPSEQPFDGRHEGFAPRGATPSDDRAIANLREEVMRLREQVARMEGEFGKKPRFNRPDAAKECKRIRDSLSRFRGVIKKRAEADGKKRGIDLDEPGQWRDLEEAGERAIRILSEILAIAEAELDGRNPGRRRYSAMLLEFAYVLRTLGPRAYRVLRGFIPLPSEQSLWKWAQKDKAAIRALLTSVDDDGPVAAFLDGYRKRYGLTPDQIVQVLLAWDATAATQAAVQAMGMKTGYAMTYMMLPLNHVLPGEVLRCIPHETGRIDDTVHQHKDRLIAVLEKKKFHVRFLATDGDRGMDASHRDFYNSYAGPGACEDYWDLNKVVKKLVEIGKPFIVTDLLHLMKNIRTRIACALQGLKISVHGEAVTAESITALAELGQAVLGKKGPVDRMKDHLALQLFKLKSFVNVGMAGDGTALVFFLPLAALNLAVRCDEMEIETRCELIADAYETFQRILQRYPETGKNAEIYENLNDEVTSTLWTRNQCIRGCNLCVALYMACTEWADSKDKIALALNRIGTHSVECFFGMMRSVMRGDARFKILIDAEVNAILVKQLLADFNVSPRIRRFINAGGCTLTKEKPGKMKVNFAAIREHIDEVITSIRALGVAKTQLQRTRSPQRKKTLEALIDKEWKRNRLACSKIMAPFFELFAMLKSVGWREKVDVSSEMAALGLHRFFGQNEQWKKDVTIIGVDDDDNFSA